MDRMESVRYYEVIGIIMDAEEPILSELSHVNNWNLNLSKIFLWLPELKFQILILISL